MPGILLCVCVCVCPERQTGMRHSCVKVLCWRKGGEGRGWRGRNGRVINLVRRVGRRRQWRVATQPRAVRLVGRVVLRRTVGAKGRCRHSGLLWLLLLLRRHKGRRQTGTGLLRVVRVDRLGDTNGAEFGFMTERQKKRPQRGRGRLRKKNAGAWCGGGCSVVPGKVQRRRAQCQGDAQASAQQ